MNVAVVRGGPGKLRQEITMGKHRVTADVPEADGGEDAGPTPHDLLAAALGACTALTLRLYAARKQWPLTDAEVTVTVERTPEMGRFQRDIRLVGALDAEQKARLLKVAEACPVHKTLSGKIEIASRLV